VDDIKKRIMTFLEPSLGGKEISDQDDIFSLGYVNSLFAMQLVAFIEREFSLTVGSEDLEFDNFRTVSGMANLVAVKKGIAH
jgi:acyl carrier protein